MPTPSKGPRLGGGPAHERLLLGNLATSLFAHGSITTTEAKAKRLRPLAERLITLAKRGDLHARRKVLTVIHDKQVVHSLFTETAALLEEREGGYTRITKIGPRKGDNAPMAVIEVITEPVVKKQRAAETAESLAPATDAEARAEEAEVAGEVAADQEAADADNAADAVDEVSQESVDPEVADAGAEEADTDEAAEVAAVEPEGDEAR